VGRRAGLWASSSSASSGGQPVDASAFSAGARIAFAPTAGNRHLTVFLDAGHGGLDPGSVGTTQSGTTIYEATETLPVELDTMAILRREGFRVVVSRTRNSSGPADPGWFNTPSQMPGALIEPLFITDPFEGSIAASSEGQHTIAAGLANAVEQYFAG
jgi:N-acetylmuramoyl-L-alanine amidase